MTSDRQGPRKRVGGRVARSVLMSALVAAACSGGPGAGPATDAPPGAATIPPVPDVLMPAPDLAGVALRDQGGEPVVFEALRGKPMLLTFIYTRCPMPEMCPATTLRFQEVQKALAPEERPRVRLASVSFDPSFDTPEVLAEYAELWEVDASVWTLLTGSEDAVHAVASAYGVWYERAEDGTYRHPMYSMILLPDGALHRVLLGSAWDAREVARTLLSLAPDLGSTPR